MVVVSLLGEGEEPCGESAEECGERGGERAVVEQVVTRTDSQESDAHLLGEVRQREQDHEESVVVPMNRSSPMNKYLSQRQQS